MRWEELGNGLEKGLRQVKKSIGRVRGREMEERKAGRQRGEGVGT